MSGPLHVFVDFDGTITHPDTLRVLTERLGAGVEHYEATGKLLRAGSITLRDGIERDMRGIGVGFAEAAAVLLTHVTVDVGFGRLARWCGARRVPLTVLSGGFEEIVDLFLVRSELPAVDVSANRFRAGSWECIFRDASPAGNDKAAVVAAARAGGRNTVLVGDGFSDEAAAAVADLVYAKHRLAAWCRREGVACEEFETLTDVLESLARRVNGGPRGEESASG